MNVGIIVYSQTGNTYSVSLKLEEKLRKAGHAVTLERIEVAGAPPPPHGSVQFKTIPDTSPYDMLIFASPVQAFSVATVMSEYLGQIGSLAGRKTALMVTHFFPFAWMGALRAVKQMKDLCEAKGAAVVGTGIVNWSRGNREKVIGEIGDRFKLLCK